MVSRRRFLAAVAGASLGAVLAAVWWRWGGAGGGEAGGVRRCGEVRLVYGREECPVCKMVVDYPPSAAAMRARVRGVERWYFFDDVGCMAVWYREVKRQGGEVLEVCVRDRVDGSWIRGEDAVYLATGEFTAMQTGIVAVSPDNVEAYKRGVVKGPWRIETLDGPQDYSPPPPGEVRGVVDFKCLVEKFDYGAAWSVDPNWHRGC